MDAAATGLGTTAVVRTPSRRRPRDWVVDTLLFLVAVIFGVLVVGGQLESPTPVEPGWLFTADMVAGAVGCLGLWFRRRWPVGLALVL